MVKIVTTIDKTGPFFRSVPSKTFLENVRVMLEAVAKEGEQDAEAQLRVGQAGRELITYGGDRVSQHVVGRVTSIAGRKWGLSAVISVNNSHLNRAQGISLMAAASEIEGRLHVFRRTTSRLRSAKAINLAELTKGLN